MSTCKAEYYAASHAVRKFIWFKNVIMGLQNEQKMPLDINSDSNSTIRVAEHRRNTKLLKNDGNTQKSNLSPHLKSVDNIDMGYQAGNRPIRHYALFSALDKYLQHG